MNIQLTEEQVQELFALNLKSQKKIKKLKKALKEKDIGDRAADLLEEAKHYRDAHTMSFVIRNGLCEKYLNDLFKDWQCHLSGPVVTEDDPYPCSFIDLCAYFHWEEHLDLTTQPEIYAWLKTKLKKNSSLLVSFEEKLA